MKKSTIIPHKPCHFAGLFVRKLLIAGIILGVLCGCQSSDSCRKVLHAKCVQCHSAATSCEEMGQSEDWWLRTIDGMAKLGAEISKQERKALAKCLSNPSETNIEKICK